MSSESDDSAPPVRPSAPVGTPPPLRPRSMDASIPLAQRDPTPNPAPAVLRGTPPPARPTSARLTPTPSPAPRASMDSDDQVVDDLEAQFNATPPPAPPPPPEVQDTAKPKRWFERWLIGPDQPKAGQTFTRLSRHLSYEVVVTTVTFLMASILLFTSFNGEMRDLYIKARELIGAYPAVTSDEVVLVTVGTEALYLWNPEDPAPEVTPRALLGEVVSILDSAGANVIVLDFLLHAPAPGDERLAQASTAHGAVIAADRFVVTEAAVGAHFAPGPAASLGEAMASGFANLGEEALWTSSDERLVRGTQLVQSVDRARLSAPWPASVGQAQGASQITPHMALLAAWMHTHPGRASTDTLLARLADGCTPRPLSCKTSLADLGLPGGPALEGAFPINFRGPESADGLATVQAAQLLRLAAEPALYRMAGVETPAKIPTWLSNEVKGKIVVVGRVDGQADDRFATPYGFPLPTRTDMDGARIQAHAIDTLLSGRHVQSAPRWTMWTLAGVVLLGLVLTSTRLREDLHTALALASGLVLVLIGAIIFTLTDGLVLDLSVPLTSLILGIVAIRLRGWAID